MAGLANGDLFSVNNPHKLGEALVLNSMFSDMSNMMHFDAFLLILFTPEVISVDMTLINTDWTPPEQSALEQTDEVEMLPETDAFISNILLNP